MFVKLVFVSWFRFLGSILQSNDEIDANGAHCTKNSSWEDEMEGFLRHKILLQLASSIKFKGRFYHKTIN